MSKTADTERYSMIGLASAADELVRHLIAFALELSVMRL
jgi:hypothetical protein